MNIFRNTVTSVSVSLYTQSTYVIQLAVCFEILSNTLCVLIFLNTLVSRSMMHVNVFCFCCTPMHRNLAVVIFVPLLFLCLFLV